MAKFIKLEERHGGVSILLNIEQISSIRDLRTDKVLAENTDWHYTIIICGGCSYEVKERYDDIIERILY